MTENKSNWLQIQIILFNCKDDVKTYEEICQKKLQPINNFREVIEIRFKNFIKKNGEHLTIMTPNYRIYCGTENILTVGREIDIYGEAGLHEIIELAKDNDWKIYDKGLNDFIDHNFPKNFSYIDFKNSK